MAETGRSNKTVKMVARIVFTKTSCDWCSLKSKIQLLQCQQDSGYVISITNCNDVSFPKVSFLWIKGILSCYIYYLLSQIVTLTDK